MWARGEGGEGERDVQGQRPLQAVQGEWLVLVQTLGSGCAMGVCAGEPCARHDAWPWEYGNVGIRGSGNRFLGSTESAFGVLDAGGVYCKPCQGVFRDEMYRCMD